MRNKIARLSLCGVSHTMSDGNRGGGDTPGLKRWLWPAIIFAVSVLAYGGFQQWLYYDHAARNAASYSRDAKDQIAAECRLAITPAACAREIEQIRRANQRDEYDLYSQMATALWTAIMGAMAVVGVALSGVGVYLIWGTWRQTAEAAESARRTLRSYIAKERAFLKAVRIDFSYSDEEPEKRSGFRVGFKNEGFSAGTITEIAWQYAAKELWLDGWNPTLHCKPIVIPPGETVHSPAFRVSEFPSDPCWLMGYAKYSTLEQDGLCCYFFAKVYQPEGEFYFGPEWYATLERRHAMPDDT